MRQTSLGRLYQDGDIIFRKGDLGDCMYLVQKGAVEVILDESDDHVPNVIRSGEFFGEMSLFSGEPRTATIRCRGESRIMTIDERAFMRRMREDPILAFRILERSCDRMRSREVRRREMEAD